MKKLFALLAIVSLSVPIYGCGGKKDEPAKPADKPMDKPADKPVDGK